MFEGRVDKVVEGRNGRLFIADHGPPEVDSMLAEDTFPSWRLKLWRLSLEMHAAYLAERNIPYVVLVAPDAVTACIDDLPEGWPRPRDQVGRIFANAMAGIPNLTVVYPLEALRQAEGGLPVYKKNDTHWSAYGGFIAYRALLEALSPGLDIRRVEARDVSFGMKNLYGNLGSHADFDRKLPTPVSQVEGTPSVVIRRSAGAARRGFQVVRNDALAARALVLRDSFAGEMGPYLAATFGEMWSFGATRELPYDLVGEARPDVLIMQISERAMLLGSTEHEELGWRELYDVEIKSPAGKACAKLLQALDPKSTAGPTAAADLASDVANAKGLQPQHLIHSSLAFYRAGRHKDAARYARRAVQLDPTFASAWRLIALSEMASPDREYESWSRAAKRMLRLAPRNARYHHDYAAGLGAFGRYDQSVAATRAAVEAFPDYPALRVQLARSLAKAGDPSAALEALSPALELLPPTARPHIIAERLRNGLPWQG